MISPLIEIVPVPGPLDLDGVQGLVFTSANGVEQFAARSADRSLPAWCVGEMTAAAARRAGFAARSADGDVGDLAALVVAAQRAGRGRLPARARAACGGRPRRHGCAAAGVPARAAEIYDQAPRPLTAEARALLAAGGIDVLTFFSPRTARLFAAEARAPGGTFRARVAVSLSAGGRRGLRRARAGRARGSPRRRPATACWRRSAAAGRDRPGHRLVTPKRLA